MDGKFNFVSIACAGEYVNVNQIDEGCAISASGELNGNNSKRDQVHFPRVIKAVISSISSEPENRAHYRAAATEILNELVGLLVVTEVPVSQRYIAPTEGVIQAKQSLPSLAV